MHGNHHMKLRAERWLRQRLGSTQAIARGYQFVRQVRLKCVRIENRSPYTNIYYCCTQKTASQWLRSVLNDPIVFKYMGLKVLPYVQLGLKYAAFQEPFPTDPLRPIPISAGRLI